ncbi:MAG: HAMP domain-containing sensor histidine kinase [Hyphomicrobium sp.]
MTSGSLRLRLAAGGGAAIALALVIAGFGLSYLFERHAMRSLGEDLELDLRQVLGAVEIDAAGKPALRRLPSDPRFAEPLSGLYWQLGTNGEVSARSRSLWDSILPLPSDALEPGDVHRHRLAGPRGSDLLAVERSVLLKVKETAVPVRIVVAADVTRVAEARRSFVRELIPSLALLGFVLALATWVQIGLGLRPLARVRDGIAAIRLGRDRRLESAAPKEVAPLVAEINGLLGAQEREIERSRGRAADLAHGLKTPLAALAADVRTLREIGRPDLAARIEEVGESMRRHVERELARARIHGSRGLGAVKVTELAPLIDTLFTIQKRTSDGARVTFDNVCAVSSVVAMDKADLAEVLGNLIENAARHARSIVRVAALPDGRIAIDDDGPGIPPELRTQVIQRGERLDRRGEGVGLGLAIVSEVLEAYGRSLTLEASDLGGLRAVF